MNSNKYAVAFIPQSGFKTQLPSSSLNLQRTMPPGGWSEDTQIPPVFRCSIVMQ